MLVYLHLAKILCASNILKHITIHHFLLLDWNIMQCCESAHRFVWDLEWCIGWSHKGWPRRWIKHINHPFHIYSVLEEPAIHPDLAFCKYLLCNPTILKASARCLMGQHNMSDSTMYNMIFFACQNTLVHLLILASTPQFLGLIPYSKVL